MKFSDIKQILKDGINGFRLSYFSSNRSRYGHIDKSAVVLLPGLCIKNNVFLYKNTVIHEYHKLITPKGRFIMKDNSIAAAGLTVITFNHGYYNVGDIPNGQGWTDYFVDDVIVEEHVWIGANVTLCPGTHLNRGIVVAAGSVCIKNIEYPPYSIIGGNPAKFIKFKFTLEQQIEHEKLCFIEKDRLQISILQNNFDRFR
ncbi:acyltransferase [Flavobacterium sp. WC2509]|uniref:acyltransferase n=1 Tax=Flavobacterium sp. WC2509 TaxID=3461406 RepID=UPI0040444012